MTNLHLSMTRLVLFMSLLAIAGGAWAQQGTLRLEHKAEQTESFTDTDGVERTRLVEAGRVLPGEPIQFTVTYTNTGAEPLENITITNPVPDHMGYVEGSATGDETSITFSVDGGTNFDVSQNLAVTDEEGTLRRATAADYTHVRWVIGSDVASGASGEVQFTAVVE